MIFLSSRYASSGVVSIPGTGSTVHRSVFRTAPTRLSRTRMYQYMWRQGDRIDTVAHDQVGSPELWWWVMDANPEILDPLSIEPGTLIWIPSRV